MSESSQKIQKIVNGPCSKCSNGKMIHPELYVFECNVCGYKYRVNPAAKKKETIEILQKSILKVRK